MSACGRCGQAVCGLSKARWARRYGLTGRHQLRILPEHEPGPIARNPRVRYSTGGCSTAAIPLEVEIGDLACYEAAYGLGGAE